MTAVSIRDRRNHGGEIVHRVEREEAVTITRAKPAAQLHPVRKAHLTAPELLARCQRLPSVDPAVLRADIDATMSTRLR